MEEYILEVIIVLVLVYLFEHRIVPQIILIFASVMMLLKELTVSGFLPQTILLFAAVILYSGMNILKDNKEEEQ